MPFKKGQSGNESAKFKKGQSGNPGGRPKGFAVSEAIRRELVKEVPKDKQKRTFAEMIAFRLVVLAATGDVPAIKEVIDRTEGKARQPIDVEMRDWREAAAKLGLSEEDVIAEAEQLLQESAD